MEKTYNRRKVLSIVRKLHNIMENKLTLEMHNEIGNGHSGLTLSEEMEASLFNLKHFIKKHVK